MIKNFISLFPVWAIFFSTFCYFEPSVVTGFKGLIIPMLVIIMFCMGVTLSVEDFKRVLQKPKVILLTTFIQFLIMPLVAFIVSKILGFSLMLTAGMVLVGAVSGGTASNVIAYIAKADVALSIAMTVFSTIVSVVITPFLTWLYLGQSIPIDALGMLLSIVKIVLIPVLLGVVVNLFFHRFISKFTDLFALSSIIAIVFVIGIIVGLNQGKIENIGFLAFLGVVLHNMAGLIGGYSLAKLFKYDEKTCRTVAIEVGMQNSGLAIALAMKYFSSIATLPGAIFSIWHNISGSILAGFWSKQETKASENNFN